jgi:apolipoprotein N-acyltransferase
VSASLAARTSPYRARVFRRGFAAGVVYFAGTLYWVVPVMDSYGDLPLTVAVLVGALLIVWLSLYPALFALIVAAAVRRFGIGGLWVAPAVWVTGEWLRSWVLSGFGWAFLGSSQATVLPVVQLASVVGVYGLSAYVALVSTAVSVVALGGRRIVPIGVAILFVGVAAAGVIRVQRGALLTEGTPIRVGLLQGNIEQAQKEDSAFRGMIIDRYMNMSREALAAGASLVVWPEASTPFYFDLEESWAAPIRQLAADRRTPFLIGTDELQRGATREEDRYYNSAVLVGADGRSHGVYRKMRLVPYGEYVPFKKVLFFVGPLVQAVSSFSHGTEPVVFDAGGRRISVSICYESIFPWLSRAFVQRGSQLLATITNDAWFGRSSAAYQHFEQGAIRAVEEGRYIVRAANTGISGAVDPYGRVLAATGLFETAVVPVDVRLLDHRTIYSRLGDVAVWISLAVTAWTLFMSRLR